MATNNPERNRTQWLFDAPRFYDFNKTEEENNHMGDDWFAQQDTSSSFFSHQISSTTINQQAASPTVRKDEDQGLPSNLRYNHNVNYTADVYLHSPSQRRHHSQEGLRRRDIKLELKKKVRHEQSHHLNKADQQQETMALLDDNRLVNELWSRSSPTPTDITTSFLYENTTDQLRNESPPPTTQEFPNQQDDPSSTPIAHEYTAPLDNPSSSPIAHEYTDQLDNQPASPIAQDYTDQNHNHSSASSDHKDTDQQYYEPSSPVTKEFTDQRDTQPLSHMTQGYTDNNYDQSPPLTAHKYTDQQYNDPSSPITQEYTDQQYNPPSPLTSNIIEEHANNLMDKQDEEEEQEYRIVKLPILGVTIKSPIPKPNASRKTGLDRSVYHDKDDSDSPSRYNPVSASPLRSDWRKSQKEDAFIEIPNQRESKLNEASEGTDFSIHQKPAVSDRECVPSTPRKRPHSPEPDYHQQAPPQKATKTSSPEPRHPSSLLQLITRVKSYRHPPTESPLLKLIAKVRSRRPFPTAIRKETVVERARRVMHEAYIKSKKWNVLSHRRMTAHRHSVLQRPYRYLTPAPETKRDREDDDDSDNEQDAYLDSRPVKHEPWTTHPGNSFVSPYLPVSLTVPRSPKFATDKRLKRY